jgi:cation:H+ antiporter
MNRPRLQDPTLALAIIAAVALGLDDWLDRPLVQFDRFEGIALLLTFVAFLHYAVSAPRRELPHAVATARQKTLKSSRVFFRLILAPVGLSTVTSGAHLTVDATRHLTQSLRVFEAFIGLAFVAVGTSLPELVTAIVALRHGEPELPVGSVLGSNIFNLLFVLGATALIQPIPIASRGLADLLATSLLSGMLLILAAGREHRFGRMKVGVLLICCVSYVNCRGGWT